MFRGPVLAGILLIVLSVTGAVFALRGPQSSDEAVPAAPALQTSAPEDAAAPVEDVQPESLLTAKETVIVKEIINKGVPVVLPVPAQLDFCGEPVPLDQPDIRERLERELYIMAHRYHHVIFYIKRGHRVLQVIDREIERKGLPRDLRYVAVAESDLNPLVKSPAGARGVWQFMEGTAKRYDLRVDKFVDERLHVPKATRAALDYLKDNRDDLGSWTMSAAAYNMGEARARRIQKDQRSRDFYRLYMNEETSRYIFRILAAKLLLSDPKAYGYDIPETEIYRAEETRTVRLGKAVPDLLAWSLSNGLTYYDVKRLNPWIISDRLPAGNFELSLPVRGPETLATSAQ